MNYRYKKSQIFNKVLPVPRNIRNDVYNCNLSFADYIKYNLEDKIPITCLTEIDRNIVVKFGLNRAKRLDWNVLSKVSETIKYKLLEIPSNVEDLNDELYQILSTRVAPKDYSKEMREKYPYSVAKINDEDSEEIRNLKTSFNSGNITLTTIIKHWDIFKDNDLTYQLSKDYNNKAYKITDKELKNYMNEFSKTTRFISQRTDIYKFIREYSDCKTEDEKNNLVKPILEEILTKTNSSSYDAITLNNEQYKEIFRYISMRDCLSKNSTNQYSIDRMFEDLEYEGLNEEYILDSEIPFRYINNYDVLHFIGVYGLKNIIEFDRECGNFFTKNNCEMLKNMFDYYMHYAINDHDPNTTFYTKKNTYDSDGHLIERPYTKDEFYEAMRRMIVSGPSDYTLRKSAPNYQDMTGEFKRRNSDLFITDDAPEELKQAFYTKKLTPDHIRKHPEYIPYLEGKNLASCFTSLVVQVNGTENYHSFENIYKFICDKTDYYTALDIVKEYSDAIKIIFDGQILNSYDFRLTFDHDDDIDTIINKINDMLIKIIVEKNYPYPENIPTRLYEKNKELFLSKDAPVELQKAFYTRSLKTSLLLDNPSYIDYIKDKKLKYIFRYLPVGVYDKGAKQYSYYYSTSQKNLLDVIEETFKEDAMGIMLEYGKYIEEIYDINKLSNLQIEENSTKDAVLDSFDELLLESIVKYSFKYDEKVSSHFKSKNKTLFIDESLPEEFKNKFYNREFTIEDFNNNSDLIDLFGDTNVVCGFSEKLSWMIPIINGENHQLNNLNRLKLLTEYYKIQDVSLQEIFREYVEGNKDNLNMETISYIGEVLSRLSVSNSTEMYTYRKELAHQILESNDPIDTLNKVESLFIKNNIPMVGKIYSCFEILHPDFKGFNMDSETISPVLKKSSNKKRSYIIFNDLLKAALGSNNQSINKYINNLDQGNKLYLRVKKDHIPYEDLSKEEQEQLKKFRSLIRALYDKSFKGKRENDSLVFTDDVIKDIERLEVMLSADGETDYDLANRVVRMFCGSVGLNTIEEVQKYVYEKVKSADKRNRERAGTAMTLEVGDLVKGINDIKYLRNILQNGSVSKEYLGSSATSDATPLDTDASMILTSTGTVGEKISTTIAKNYGPVWIVLKNDGRFETTRKENEVTDPTYDINKLELFQTGALGSGHYGIRTGFASSEIDYFIMDPYDTRVGFEIAMTGFYIPVVNNKGEIVFTPEDYDEIREKMAGLTNYDEPNFVFSENLVNGEIAALASQIEDNKVETKYKRDIITKAIKEVLEEFHLKLKTSIDGDLTEGSAELIDTGSTGRATNKIGDGDFDFMMRLDREIMQDSKKLQALKTALLEKFGVESKDAVIGTGDFRIEGVKLADVTVDIDISFETKTDSIVYSTDMALQDRLETIKKQDPEKYKYVIANILLAKKVLKEANVYKPNRGKTPQGGLGGVGVENWILQNGGSFYDAAKSFLAASENKSFEQFLHTYEVWDFGENHMAEKKNKYIHDEFVACNMSREGYLKMCEALKKYLKQVEDNHNYTSSLQM